MTITETNDINKEVDEKEIMSVNEIGKSITAKEYMTYIEKERKPCFKCKRSVRLAYELCYKHPRDNKQVICEQCMASGVWLAPKDYSL